MNPHLAPSSPNAPPAPAFPQVLYIGRSGSAALIAALRRDGVDVIVAFDSERGASLLNHVQPQAILCAAADAQAVLAYAEPNVHVIVLGHEEWVCPRPATTVISSTLEVADVAHRVREDIAAQFGTTDSRSTVSIRRISRGAEFLRARLGPCRPPPRLSLDVRGRTASTGGAVATNRRDASPDVPKASPKAKPQGDEIRVA
jgi:hypothetical protein